MNSSELKFYVLTIEKNNTEIIIEKGKLESCRTKLKECTGYEGLENPYKFEDAVYSIIEGNFFSLKKRIERMVNE